MEYEPIKPASVPARRAAGKQAQPEPRHGVSSGTYTWLPNNISLETNFRKTTQTLQKIPAPTHSHHASDENPQKILLTYDPIKPLEYLLKTSPATIETGCH
jgi:hypothetical protein